jgi:hypothetical protein
VLQGEGQVVEASVLQLDHRTVGAHLLPPARVVRRGYTAPPQAPVRAAAGSGAGARMIGSASANELPDADHISRASINWALEHRFWSAIRRCPVPVSLKADRGSSSQVAFHAERMH